MKLKTLSYSIMHFSVAFTVSFILTGDIAIASAFALIEPFVQTVAYFFHEKAWANYSKNKEVCLLNKEDYKFSFGDLFTCKHN